MRTIAVIPAYHEETRITPVIQSIRALVDAVVVVDDGSSDRTQEVAKQAGAIALRHRLNRGQGAALRTGTEAAIRLGADIIVHVDADGQHDPQMIPVLSEPLRAGEADVVFGSRFMGIDPTDMPKVRRMYFHLAKLFNIMVVGISKQITDPQSGARAMNRVAAQRIQFTQDRAAHCSEILRRVTQSDLRWKEVPVHVRYTEDTLKKGQSFFEAFKILWHLIIRGTK
ncbi:glycosyltransferase [Candidatus Uhrbacteria bacterium]|nr:glycosyltransferase [Candidatus Uhrbacteria bacterium]MBD3284215.1 glycosyltransferase [Candidatus Uhrbacteria bacterium]